MTVVFSSHPSRPSLLLPRLLFAVVLCGPLPGSAQQSQNSQLDVTSIGDCPTSQLAGAESGGQWIIGTDIPIYGMPNSHEPLGTLQNTFEPVSCYAEVEFLGESRVFVANYERNLCGWVARSDLLDEHRRDALSVLGQRRRAVCETPRAMRFEQFCSLHDSLSDDTTGACEGVPAGLRAKGVLTGWLSNVVHALEYPFWDAPIGGRQRETQALFSVLEVHDLARGSGTTVMALVGDGDGELFGWVDLHAIELWPTRLGLFYDVEGRGAMFRTDVELTSHWRDGHPEPNVLPGGDPAAIREFVHGPLPLLSYPIVRTINEFTDPLKRDSDPDYHQVVFFGQSGRGSASDIINQSEIADTIAMVQEVNIMLVVDTTESMRPYLPLIREGISQFIDFYRTLEQNARNNVPDFRVAVYAYSDFEDSGRRTLSSPIRTDEVMSPIQIQRGFDVRASLRSIESHRGLDDPVGSFREAALEAVVQLGERFESPEWFEGGPRVVIHIADHGSRDHVDPAVILSRLADRRIYYFPVPVTTADRSSRGSDSQGRREAREAFFSQAATMLRPLVSDARSARREVQRYSIDLSDLESATAERVSDPLQLVMGEVMEAVAPTRQVTEGQVSSRLAQDLASSEIRLNERLREAYNLPDASDIVVQASTGFAPLEIKDHGLAREISWTYTVALEPDQANFLRTNIESVCEMIGRPEQRNPLRRLIIQLAEVFSGDEITDSELGLRAVLSDLRHLPGADDSFLAQTPSALLARIDSTDPVVIEELRRDVCWISFHLGNMNASVYARPDQLEWREYYYGLRAGEEVTHREYLYAPPIGADTVYLPSFFFLMPSAVEVQRESGDPDCTGFFCQ